MKRVKIISILFAVVFIGVFLVNFVSAFSGSGSGTESNPYLITDCNQLAEMNNDLTAHYALDNDIDCSGFGNWNPIAPDYSGDAFSGSLDGRGYVINGLTSDHEYAGNYYNNGLIGRAYGATITRLGLTNIYIRGGGHVGGFIGYGIATISESFIRGGSVLGDSVGSSDWSFTGGFAGRGSMTVSDCYIQLDSVHGRGDWTSAVSAFNYIVNSNIRRCYSATPTTFSGSDSQASCFTYINYGWSGGDSSIFSANFVDKDVCSISGSPGYTIPSNSADKKTTSEMKTKSTFDSAGWDIDDLGSSGSSIWIIDEGNDYPRLRWETASSSCGDSNCDIGECNTCAGDCSFSDCCGDGNCGNGPDTEDCNTCPSDCGTCPSVHECTTYGNDDIILKLFSQTNSHAEIWNQPNYDYEICYSEIFGNSPPADSHVCKPDSSNRVVGLSDVTNAQAEVPSLNNYLENVCYADLVCEGDSSPGDTCSNGGEIVIRLSSDTNSHVSIASETSYPVKICCVEAGISRIDSVFWEDMRGRKINLADLNDRVKLELNGVSISGNIEYEIWKRVPLWLDEKVMEISESGVVTWRAGSKNDGTLEEGEYYFRARLPGENWVNTEANSEPYKYLLVSDTENNNPPVAEIANPIDGGIYFNKIDMNQTSYDSDDFFDYAWNLGDGNIINGNSRDYINYNFSYDYQAHSGTTSIRLNIEDERGASDSDQVSILILDSTRDGKYIVPIISSPEQGSILNGSRSRGGNITANATKSFAIEYVQSTDKLNCLGGNCPFFTSTGKVVEDPHNLRGDYSTLKFEWEFDDGSNCNPALVANCYYFKKIFAAPGAHWAILNVSLVSDSNIAALTETNFSVRFKNYCNDGGDTWWDSDGIRHNTLNEYGYCTGYDGVPGAGGDDDCCPSGYLCNNDGIGEICQVDPGVVEFCDNIFSCSDYTDENSCKSDLELCKVGLPGGGGVGTDNCEGTKITRTECAGMNFVTTNCSCVWDSGNNNCKLGTKVVSSIFSSIPLKENECSYSVTHSPCVDGRMNIEETGDIIWSDETLQTVVNLGFAANLGDAGDYLRNTCGYACPSESGTVICGEDVVKMPFFGGIHFIITVISIALIYGLFWNRFN
jgi:hypothetical protein